MQTIVFLFPISETILERVRAEVPGWKVIAGREPAVWLDSLPKASIIVGWNALAAEHALSDGTPLRWVHNWGAGVNGLPLDALRERGIVLTNTSGVHAFPISETIFGMMLAFTRKLDVYVRQQERRVWHHGNLRGEIHGKTLGLLGTGAIGAETAHIGKAFSMRVLGFNRTGAASPDIKEIVSLENLLAESDFVVNSLPLSTHTHHLMGASQFARMRPNSYYINVGRGGTTDTEALLDALRTGKIAGAGLDVFEQEPLPADHPLWAFENVLIAPHSSGSTEHYDERAAEIFLANLRDYMKGAAPAVNVVDYDYGY